MSKLNEQSSLKRIVRDSFNKNLIPNPFSDEIV